MIYGNFSLGSKSVQLSHETKNLGEVPEINLLKLEKGSIVRFHGKYWRVKKLSPGVIHLEPTENRKNPVDFTYPGNSRTTDPYILDEAWKILSSDKEFNRLFEAKVGNYFNTMRTTARESFNESSIPCYRSLNSIRYFTFGGLLVNRAIALIQDHNDFEADDISVMVNSPIHWSQLSEGPHVYERIFPKLFDKALSQSLFQMLLPLNMQLNEYLQYWLKDEATYKILKRLKHSSPVEISQELINKLGLV